MNVIVICYSKIKVINLVININYLQINNEGSMGENTQQIVLAFIALFISYAFACGIVLIFNFAVGMKYRHEIEFRVVKK